ncbi:MAG TPA: hydrogenase expression/formation protein HypE [Gemmatales bacterium]|nr:hydrogenase expression/formation protein HypE [Gemmatales bacterium]
MAGPVWQFNCPVSVSAQSDCVTLAHGEGGRLMRRLLDHVIHPSLRIKPRFADAAFLRPTGNRLAFSTDSYVVSPLFFPGGDIGTLGVYGTCNDLAVTGAIPRWLSLSLIIEEGLPLPVLEKVLQSVAQTTAECQIQIVTGDTKVVPHGEIDGLFLNTTGIGELIDPIPPGPEGLQVNDVLIVSGPIGRHGIAILAAREQLDFQPAPASDCAPLFPAIQALRSAIGSEVRALRDATRGGVTAVLHEWAIASGKTLFLDESRIPVDSVTRSACELLGLEPLHLACEGTMLLAVASTHAEQAVSILRTIDVSRQAAIIGTVQPRTIAPVIIRRVLGREQSLDEPTGAPLPRIC